MNLLFFHALICFIAYFAIHWLIFRITGPKFFMAKSLSLLAFSVIFIFVYSSYLTVPRYAFFFLIYVGICNAYLIFLINLQNSISFRILNEMSNSNVERFNLKQVAELYPVKTIINDRLTELNDNGFIVLSNGEIQLTKKGYYFGLGIQIFQRVFGISVSG